MKRRVLVHRLLLLAVLLLAAGLRLHALEAQSLWNDEGTSVALAQRDLAAIARDAAADIHPPLYYVLLRSWVWLLGTGEAAVRSLSAALGIGLVALTYALGHLLLGRWPGLLAALLAAASPVQVVYSQEARMYMLLAVLAAGAMLALAHWVRKPSWHSLAALALLEAAGLWTHYSFLFVALAVNLAFLLSWRRGAPRRLAPWTACQAAVVLLYAPWLPIALRQAGSWPSPVSGPLFPALADAWRWLAYGPTMGTRPILAALARSAFLAVAGLLALLTRPRGTEWPARWPGLLLLAWIGVPLAFLLGLGLVREAYLKFLLVASPAVCFLLAGALTWPWLCSLPAKRLYPLRAVQLLLILGLLAGCGVSLYNYFAEPAYARDDYRAIASYVEALGRPGDAILLNAPGQQEVFGYYYHGDLPVHPLPESRPPDRAATDAALARLAAPRGRIFAVLWATDESDPDRLVEGWLDRYTYKALDSWYGNVRLAVYAVPAQTPAAPGHRLDLVLADATTGDQVTLVGYSLLDPSLASGDIAQISLYWRVDRTPSRRYKVFVHILDEASQIAGQHDREPGAGVALTTLWEPGTLIADHLGVAIHPATPPGEYRVEVGLYDAETGLRLVGPDGASQAWLEPLEVARPASPAPAATLGPHAAVRADFGAIRLLSWDLYKQGYAHDRDQPLHPGDLLHADLFWQADEQPEGDWSAQVSLVDRDGGQVLDLAAAPALSYPTSLWQAGDVWRGQLNLAIPADARPGRYRLRVLAVPPGGLPGEAFLSEPFEVEEKR